MPVGCNGGLGVLYVESPSGASTMYEPTTGTPVLTVRTVVSVLTVLTVLAVLTVLTVLTVLSLTLFTEF